MSDDGADETCCVQLSLAADCMFKMETLNTPSAAADGRGCAAGIGMSAGMLTTGGGAVGAGAIACTGIATASPTAAGRGCGAAAAAAAACAVSTTGTPTGAAAGAPLAGAPVQRGRQGDLVNTQVWMILPNFPKDRIKGTVPGCRRHVALSSE